MHTAAEIWNVRKYHGVVWFTEDRLRNVSADLVGVNVERADHLDIADRQSIDFLAHHPDDGNVGFRLAVVRESLNQGRRAVAYSDQANPD